MRRKTAILADLTEVLVKGKTEGGQFRQRRQDLAGGDKKWIWGCKIR